jgi:hypothetical protein
MIHPMDLSNPKLLYLKGGLFVLLGVLSAVLILIEMPTLRMAGLLTVCVWAFARAYYFVFYVIQHYIDPSYKFAGLGSFLRYVMRRP